MLLLVALMDRLHSALKDKRPYHTASADDAASASAATAPGSGGGADPPPEWVGVMKTRINKYDQNLLKELSTILSDFEDELLPCGDAAEVLDVMGVLPEVLAESTDANTWLGLL